MDFTVPEAVDVRNSIGTYLKYQVVVKAKVNATCPSTDIEGQAQHVLYRLKDLEKPEMKGLLFQAAEMEINYNNHNSWMRIEVDSVDSSPVGFSDQVKMDNKSSVISAQSLAVKDILDGFGDNEVWVSVYLKDFSAMTLRFHKDKKSGSDRLKIVLHTARLFTSKWEAIYDNDIHNIVRVGVCGGPHGSAVDATENYKIVAWHFENYPDIWHRTELKTDSIENGDTGDINENE